MSGRLLLWFSTTVNWLTARNSLFSGVLPVDQPDLVGLGLAVADAEFDVNAVGEQAVEGFVVVEQSQGIGTQRLAECLVTGRGGDGRVEPVDGGAQPLVQDDVAVVAFFARPFGDVRAVEDRVVVVIAAGVSGRSVRFRIRI